MPKVVRELASFLALVVDITTKNNPQTLTTTDIRCFEKGCHGLIKSEVLSKKMIFTGNVQNARMKV